VKRFNSAFPLSVNSGQYGSGIKEKQMQSIPRRHGNIKPLGYTEEVERITRSSHTDERKRK
jgi:hypothetical protein